MLFLSISGDITIMFKDNQETLLNFSYKDAKKVISMLKFNNILCDLSLEPFLDFHQQLNLSFHNNNDIDIVEGKIFMGNEFNLTTTTSSKKQKSKIKSLKAFKMVRKTMVTCPKCGRIVSFDYDDALKFLEQ